MSPALRNQASARLVQSFSATAPKTATGMIGARNLSITEPREANPVNSTFESAVASMPRRSEIASSRFIYNTSRTMKQVNDSSTVDFAYIPSMSSPQSLDLGYSRIPLLPDNFLVRHVDTAPEPHVAKAEISTATLSAAVATMSEAEISKAADAMGLHETTSGTESAVRRVWNDILDDVFGGNKAASATI